MGQVEAESVILDCFGSGKRSVAHPEPGDPAWYGGQES